MQLLTSASFHRAKRRVSAPSFLLESSRFVFHVREVMRLVSLSRLGVLYFDLIRQRSPFQAWLRPV
nr:MAG TPA: hypothetical protein [Caudoviricetes sp.]